MPGIICKIIICCDELMSKLNSLSDQNIIDDLTAQNLLDKLADVLDKCNAALGDILKETVE